MGRSSPESSISFNATETKGRLQQEKNVERQKNEAKKYAVTEKILLPIFHLFGFRLIGFSVYYYYRFVQFSVPHTHTHILQYQDEKICYAMTNDCGIYFRRHHSRLPACMSCVSAGVGS